VVDLAGSNYRWLWAVSAVYVLLAWIAIQCAGNEKKKPKSV